MSHLRRGSLKDKFGRALKTQLVFKIVLWVYMILNYLPMLIYYEVHASADEAEGGYHLMKILTDFFFIYSSQIRHKELHCEILVPIILFAMLSEIFMLALILLRWRPSSSPSRHEEVVSQSLSSQSLKPLLVTVYLSSSLYLCGGLVMSLVNSLNWWFRAYCAALTLTISLLGWFKVCGRDLRRVARKVLEYKRMRKRIHSLRSNQHQRNESVMSDETGMWTNILDYSTTSDPNHNGRVPGDSMTLSRKYSLNHYLLSSEKQ